MGIKGITRKVKTSLILKRFDMLKVNLIYMFFAILVLLPVKAFGTGSISGKVIKKSDSTPLANVYIYILQGDDPNIADEDAWNAIGCWALTDSNGDYEITGLEPRRYRVRCQGQEVGDINYLEANLFNVQVLDGSETVDVDFSLRQAGLIYGYVKTPEGDPIPSARVVAEGAWSESGNTWHGTFTDMEGRYELLLASSPGDFYPVNVEEADFNNISYAAQWDGNFYKATIEGTQVPDYILQVGGIVTGRVVNEEGVGIGGAWLSVEGSPEGVDIGPYTETDSNGDFQLNGVVPGINFISVDTGWREVEQDGVKYMLGEVSSGPVDVPSGGTVDIGTFVIYEAGMITGVITDESGFPVVGAYVEIEGKDINGDWAYREGVITDSFGQYTIDYIAPGTYLLYCFKDGFIVCIEKEINISRGDSLDCDLVLKSASQGAIIKGEISDYLDIRHEDSQGVPLPSYPESDYEEFGYCDFGLKAFSLDHIWTDMDFLYPDKYFIGSIEIDDIDDGYGDYFEIDTSEVPGKYKDWFLPSGEICAFMYYGEGENVGDFWSVIITDRKQLSLSKGDIRTNINFECNFPTNPGTIKGNLIVPSGYTDFPGDWCMIFAYKLDSNGEVVTPLPFGDAVAGSGWTTTYQFQNLSAGNYMLKVYARNLPSLTIPLVTVGSGSTTLKNIDFTNVSNGTLSGHISDGLNNIKNAVVTIVENGRNAISDDSGNYAITGISPGTYTVNITASGYADTQTSVIINSGSNIQNFILSPDVGSIAGTVKDISNNNINGAAILAYNETDKTQKTAVTVGGIFSITGLTPGQYVLAVDTDDYGVVVYPSDSSRISLLSGETENVNITVGEPEPPLFMVTSSVSNETPAILSMEFYSDRNLLAEPYVSVVDGNGVLSSLVSNSVLNRFEIQYNSHADDNIVRIRIQETNPLVPGNPSVKNFSFEVSQDLVTTSSTNVTNATGGLASIMGTQDNTKVYVPPFAIAGTQDDSQALSLIIERYGDPGDIVEGTNDQSVSAVYDFKFDDEGVSVDTNHTFTVTMSFQLPQEMTPQEFEDSLAIQYFDAGDQQWKTDGISNVRVNWLNWTIMFEVSHLTKFGAFVDAQGNIIGDFCGSGFGSSDGYVDIWDLMEFSDHWDTSTSDGNWDSKYDLAGNSFGDPDGVIDVWDLMTFADHWHEGVQP